MPLVRLFDNLLELISEMERDITNLEEFCETNNLELSEEVEAQSSYVLAAVHILKANKKTFGVSMEELDKKFKAKIKDEDALEIFLEKE